MKNKYMLISLVIIAVVFFAGGYLIGNLGEDITGRASAIPIPDPIIPPKPDPVPPPIPPPTPDTETYKVSKIVDGDTITIINGETVRLIGINTPEADEKYASEATEYLEYLIDDNEVTLESDISDRDKYDRLLRYVYVDDMFVNLEMIRQGWAHAYPYEPDVKYITEFASAEEEAKNAERGIWEQSKEVNLLVSEVNYDAEGNDNENLNDEYVVFMNDGTETVDMTGWTVKDEATHIYTFPSFSLASDSKVTLYTGEGTNTLTELYWGRKEGAYAAIWNNAGDTVYLRDADGGLVDSESW